MPEAQVADPLDEALLKRAAELGLAVDHDFAGVQVIPFDFAARSATVVLRQAARPGARLMIAKGAPQDEVLGRCGQLRTAAGSVPLGPAEHGRVDQPRSYDHAASGSASWRSPSPKCRRASAATGRPTQVGGSRCWLRGLPRPAQDSSPLALHALASSGVAVKIVTGYYRLAGGTACAGEVGFRPQPGCPWRCSRPHDRSGASPGIAAVTVVFAEAGARAEGAGRARPARVRARRGYLGDGIE